MLWRQTRTRFGRNREEKLDQSQPARLQISHLRKNKSATFVESPGAPFSSPTQNEPLSPLKTEATPTAHLQSHTAIGEPSRLSSQPKRVPRRRLPRFGKEATLLGDLGLALAEPRFTAAVLIGLGRSLLHVPLLHVVEDVPVGVDQVLLLAEVDFQGTLDGDKSNAPLPEREQWR